MSRKNTWFKISTGTGDARLETVVTNEMEQAIKFAAQTCNDKDLKLSQCFEKLQRILGNRRRGFPSINKGNVIERYYQLQQLLIDNSDIFQNASDFVQACKTQWNIGGRLEAFDNIMMEVYGADLPHGLYPPSWMVRKILNENSNTNSKFKQVGRIHPDGNPTTTTWSDTAIQMWFKHGGYFKDSVKQIEWVSSMRGHSTPQCERCGTVGSLELHHKDLDHYNNHYTNHAIVCPSCHEKFHKESLSV